MRNDDDIWGGFWRNFNRRAEDAIFDNGDYGLLVGLDKRGILVRADDCHPMIGIFRCCGSTFGQEYDHVQCGVSRFRTRFFGEDLVVGQPVYARDGRVVGVGAREIGILINFDGRYAEVLC